MKIITHKKRIYHDKHYYKLAVIGPIHTYYYPFTDTIITICHGDISNSFDTCDKITNHGAIILEHIFYTRKNNSLNINYYMELFFIK